MEKYYEEKCHACKKGNLSIIHYSNKRNYMQSSSLNNITSIQKSNSRISVILIYYYGKEQVELDTKEVTADEFNKLFEE